VVTASRGGTYAVGTARARVEHQTRYLTDLVEGHFGLRAPLVVAVELANARVDPTLAASLPAHERSLAVAEQQARRTAEVVNAELRDTARAEGAR
jgi:FMN-dependent NADH-azoreductase